MPAHSHGAVGAASGGLPSPSGNTWAGALKGHGSLYAPATPNQVSMNPLALAVTGGGAPHNNLPPFLTLMFCIALQGVFPPRS
jgi:microcystin-dependent protein